MDVPARHDREPPGALDQDDDSFLDDRGEPGRISTGDLPSDTEVEAVITAGYQRFLRHDQGTVADYIPALAQAPSLCISASAWPECTVGSSPSVMPSGEFSIQSIPKIVRLLAGLRCPGCPRKHAGSSGSTATGLPFDSVMAVELNADRTMNPMVNAGTLATTSLVPGTTAVDKFECIVAALSRFAGRRLDMDDDVYASEAATNFRNRGIAHLLNGYGRMYCEPGARHRRVHPSVLAPGERTQTWPSWGPRGRTAA